MSVCLLRTPTLVLQMMDGPENSMNNARYKEDDARLRDSGTETERSVNVL